MPTKIKFYVLFSLVALTNCTLRNNVPSSERNEIVKRYGKTLTSHFPDESYFDKGSIVGRDSNGFSNTQMCYFQHKSEELVSKLKREYSNLEVFNAYDSCLIVLNEFVNETNSTSSNYGRYTYVNQNCEDKNRIIPNFWDFELADNSTACKLPKEYKIIIIDTKPGIHCSGINEEVSSMPESIRHGFSRGIAYNDVSHDIIYWLIFW